MHAALPVQHLACYWSTCRSCQSNFLLHCVFAGLAVVGQAHAASLVSWWQAGILAHTKLAAAKVGVQSALAAFALYNYACAKK